MAAIVVRRLVPASSRRNRLAVRIDRPVGQLGSQLFLKLRIEKVLHPFGCVVQVIAGQVEVRVEIGLPQAVGPHEVARRSAPGIGELQPARSIAPHPIAPRQAQTREPLNQTSRLLAPGHWLLNEQTQAYLLLLVGAK